MSKPIRFILALHNHQPTGNFDHVFENAYRDSYLPFLDTFEPYESLKIALHTSGSLIEWLDAKHPEMSTGSPTWPPRPHRDSRWPLLRADSCHDPVAGSDRPDLRVHPLA